MFALRDLARSIASATALPAVSEPSVPTTIERNMSAIIKTPASRLAGSRWRPPAQRPAGQVSLRIATIALTITHTTMIACIQIQSGDKTPSLGDRVLLPAGGDHGRDRQPEAGDLGRQLELEPLRHALRQRRDDQFVVAVDVD